MVPLCGLVVTLVWKALTMTPMKNPLYDRFLPTKDVVASLSSTIGLCYAPGLLEALTADVPPPLAFFKSLPTTFLKNWAVYAIVLEKPDLEPLVYTGSGTSWTYGVWSRIMNYIRGEQLPVLVRKALKEGYTITHKGMYVWAPIPPPAIVPEGRLLFTGMESVFTFSFWTMGSTTTPKHYGMREMFPWEFEDLTYGGCNTHNCLFEHPIGDFDLTPEERTAHANEMYERQLDGMRKRRAEAQEYDLAAYNEELAAQGRKWRRDNPDADRAKTHRYEAKNLREGKWRCEICDRKFSRKPTLTRHLGTTMHATNVARLAH